MSTAVSVRVEMDSMLFPEREQQNDTSRPVDYGTPHKGRLRCDVVARRPTTRPSTGKSERVPRACPSSGSGGSTAVIHVTSPPGPRMSALVQVRSLDRRSICQAGVRCRSKIMPSPSRETSAKRDDR